MSVIRLQDAGVYHVTTRGVDRRDIFGDDIVGDDLRQAFLRVLGKAISRRGVLCHAYCLMGNHYHLILEALEHGELSAALHYVNGLYAQIFNETLGRTGRLFERPYRNIVVIGEVHTLEACRYVVLNPVRARLRATPAAWRWSSYRATAGIVSPPPFLTTKWTLALFGPDPAAGVRGYARFVAEGIGKPRPSCLNRT